MVSMENENLPVGQNTTAAAAVILVVSAVANLLDKSKCCVVVVRFHFSFLVDLLYGEL